MDEKIGLIGIICTPNHQRVLEEWVADKALTTEVIAEENVDLKSALKQLEQLAADVIIVDDDAKGGVNGEYALTTYIPKRKETKFILVASHNRYKEDAFIHEISNVEQFSVLLPRYYVSKKDECKNMLLQLAYSEPTPANNEKLFATYPSQPTKGFSIFKKLVREECDDILYSEVKSEFDIPESEKVSGVEYFKSVRESIKRPEKEENELEKNELELEMEKMEAEMDASVLSTENEHHDDAIPADLTDEDKELEAIISNSNEVSMPIAETVSEEMENLSLPPQADDPMIKALVQQQLSIAIKEMRLDMAVEMKNLVKSNRQQTTIYVSESAERVGATRFALSLAFAYAYFMPKLKVGLYFNNDEGSEVLGLQNNWESDKKTAIYKGVFLNKVNDLDETILTDNDINIVCLQPIGELNPLRPIYDDFYVVIGGNPWDVAGIAPSIAHYNEIGLTKATTFVLGSTASQQCYELVKELTKELKPKFWKPTTFEADFFNADSKPNAQWKELVFKNESSKSKEEKATQKKLVEANVVDKPKLTEKNETKPNVFAEYMAWNKEDWKKPENETVFKWLLGYSGPDGFSLGKEHANGKTHPKDYQVMRNKLFQWFPDEKKAVTEFLAEKEHHDDAQKPEGPVEEEKHQGDAQK